MGNINTGEKLRNSRIAKGLTQAEVANELGLTPQAISNYERGVNHIPSDVYYAMCKLYGIAEGATLFCPGLRVNQQTLDIAFDTEKIWAEILKKESVRAPQRKEELMMLFDRLNTEGQLVALDRIEELTEIPRYRKRYRKQASQEE